METREETKLPSPKTTIIAVAVVLLAGFVMWIGCLNICLTEAPTITLFTVKYIALLYVGGMAIAIFLCGMAVARVMHIDAIGGGDTFWSIVCILVFIGGLEILMLLA